MERVGLFTKYVGLLGIAVGATVTGMAGEMVYDSFKQEYAYVENAQTPCSKDDEREQRSQDLGAGILLASLGLFGMAMGYEHHSHYYLNGRDPLNLLSDEPAL